MTDGSFYYDVTEFLASVNLGVVLLISTYLQLFYPAVRAVAGEWHALVVEACLISIFPHDIWSSDRLKSAYGREYIMLIRIGASVLIQSAWYTLFPFTTFPAPPQQLSLVRFLHVLLYVLPLLRYSQQTTDAKCASAIVLVLGGVVMHGMKRLTWKRFALLALQGDKESLAVGSVLDRELLPCYERASVWIYGSLYCTFFISSYLVWDVDLPSNTQLEDFDVWQQTVLWPMLERLFAPLLYLESSFATYLLLAATVHTAFSVRCLVTKTYENEMFTVEMVDADN